MGLLSKTSVCSRKDHPKALAFIYRSIVLLSAASAAMFLCGHDSYQSSWHMFWTNNRIYFYTRGIFVIIELSHNFVCSFHWSLHLDMGNSSIFTVIHLRFIGQCSRFLNNNDLHQAMVLGVGSGSTGGFNMSLDQMGSNFSWVTQGWIHRVFGLSHLHQPATTLPWKNAPQAADETRPWNGHPRTTHLCQRLKCFKGEPSISYLLSVYQRPPNQRPWEYHFFDQLHHHCSVLTRWDSHFCVFSCFLTSFITHWHVNMCIGHIINSPPAFRPRSEGVTWRWWFEVTTWNAYQTTSKIV